jgi:hypothetical protein
VLEVWRVQQAVEREGRLRHGPGILRPPAAKKQS